MKGQERCLARQAFVKVIIPATGVGIDAMGVPSRKRRNQI